MERKKASVADVQSSDNNKTGHWSAKLSGFFCAKDSSQGNKRDGQLTPTAKLSQEKGETQWGIHDICIETCISWIPYSVCRSGGAGISHTIPESWTKHSWPAVLGTARTHLGKSNSSPAATETCVQQEAKKNTRQSLIRSWLVAEVTRWAGSKGLLYLSEPLRQSPSKRDSNYKAFSSEPLTLQFPKTWRFIEQMKCFHTLLNPLYNLHISKCRLPFIFSYSKLNKTLTVKSEIKKQVQILNPDGYSLSPPQHWCVSSKYWVNQNPDRNTDPGPDLSVGLSQHGLNDSSYIITLPNTWWKELSGCQHMLL